MILFWYFIHFIKFSHAFQCIFSFSKKNFKKGLHFVFRCAMIIKPPDTGQQKCGALAQLGERHTGSVEVSGSNPLCSTRTVCRKCIPFFSFSLFNIRKKGSNRQTPRMDPFLFICSHQIAAAPAKGCVWGFTTVLSKPSRLLPASAVRRSSLSGWPSKNLLHWHSEANNGLPLPCSLQWLYRSAAKLPQIHP